MWHKAYGKYLVYSTGGLSNAHSFRKLHIKSVPIKLNGPKVFSLHLLRCRFRSRNTSQVFMNHLKLFIKNSCFKKWRFSKTVEQSNKICGQNKCNRNIKVPNSLNGLWNFHNVLIFSFRNHYNNQKI